MKNAQARRFGARTVALVCLVAMVLVPWLLFTFEGFVALPPGVSGQVP
ncbi:MAG: hypothetical protein JO198_04485 [Candidatus Dormibacteraeota bacterium]|nr:hypothetical protein [Candidatus Dormibacteraeota bacterium]